MKPLYYQHLKKDTLLCKVLKEQQPLEQLSPTYTAHSLSLCKSIVSQQISTKVAEILFGRFLDLFDNPIPTPREIVACNEATYHSIGLSKSKASYIVAVGDFFLQNPNLEQELNHMDDKTITNTITQIKGIGKWSAEMFLMFHMGREDIFSAGDFGIQQAMIKLYNLKETKKDLLLKMETIASAWQPFRTYACLHLWQWKEAIKTHKK